MHFRIFLIGLVALLWPGCGDVANHNTGANQGTITYRVTYPDSAQYGIKSALFPREIVLVFKEEKATFIATGGFGMVQLVNLLDHKNKVAVSLMIDNLRENFACRLTPEEIYKNENEMHYDFENVPETKTIAGLTCRKLIAKNKSARQPFDIYYCDTITFHYWNSPFLGMNNLFLQYTHTVNNLTMNLEAIKVDLSSPVDTTLFELHGSYKWISQRDFFSRLSAL